MTLEPYYSDDHVTIYHGETLHVLQQLPDEAVAMMLTDPPGDRDREGRALLRAGGEADVPGSAAAVTTSTPVQLRWSSDGRVMPERYRVESSTTGPRLCDSVGDRCGNRYTYEQLGCRGDACKDTQREMGRRRRQS